MNGHREGPSNGSHVTQAGKGRVSPESGVEHGYSEAHVTFRMPSELVTRVDAAALVSGATRSEFIRRTVVLAADRVLREVGYASL